MDLVWQLAATVLPAAALVLLVLVVIRFAQSRRS